MADLCPLELLPQHRPVPSARTPHACALPAEICRKVPAGAVAWPTSFLPQQARVPSALRPQVNEPPALTSRNVPDGAVRWPKSLRPQQATARLVCTAQEWASPPSTLATTCAIGNED